MDFRNRNSKPLKPVQCFLDYRSGEVVLKAEPNWGGYVNLLKLESCFLDFLLPWQKKKNTGGVC